MFSSIHHGQKISSFRVNSFPKLGKLKSSVASAEKWSLAPTILLTMTRSDLHHFHICKWFWIQIVCEADYRKQLGNCQKCGLVVEGRYQRSWQQWYRWKGFKCNYYSIMLIVFQNHESVWDALPSRLLYMLGMKSTILPDVLYCAPPHTQKRSFR